MHCLNAVDLERGSQMKGDFLDCWKCLTSLNYFSATSPPKTCLSHLLSNPLPSSPPPQKKKKPESKALVC